MGSEKNLFQISFLMFSVCQMAKILPCQILIALYQMSILAIKNADDFFFFFDDDENKNEKSSHSACLELFIKIQAIFH